MKEVLERFKDARILVIGDLMTDLYIWGEAKRLSREAPVPVVHVEAEEYRLGGAANVANNVKALGAQVYLCGLVGYDDAAHHFRKAASEAGIATGGIFPVESWVTTTKVRVMSREYRQQLLRLDYESPHAAGEENLASMRKYVESHIGHLDALIMSDYAKGLFSNEDFARGILSLATGGRPIVVVDSKSSHLHYYDRASVVTLSYNEAERFLRHRAERRPKDMVELGTRVREIVGSKSLLLVREEQEISLFVDAGETISSKITTQGLLDTTGVRDTVVSAFALCLVAGADHKTAMMVTTRAAAKVASKVGTATVTLEELAEG